MGSGQDESQVFGKMSVARARLSEAIVDLTYARDRLNRRPPARDVAIAITEAETALLWTDRALLALDARTETGPRVA
jgi:hypothetical protein